MFYRLTRWEAGIPWRAWWLALRPKTLILSSSPVLLGTAIAFAAQGAVVWQAFFIALFTAALIQIGTNLFNDAADFEKGADSPDRLGPARAVASGWLTAREVKNAAWLAFFLAFLGGAALVYYAGSVILVIGVLSLLSGWSYTCGPFPIAYRPLGEVFVWLFFGIVATCGSFYLQTFTFSAAAFAAAALTGFHAAAVITVNNYRDAAEDAQHGKTTLAVFLGKRTTRRLFAFEILLPYAALLLLTALPFLANLALPFLNDFAGLLLNGDSSALLLNGELGDSARFLKNDLIQTFENLGVTAFLPFLTLPAAVLAIRRFYRYQGAEFNALLAFTARLQFAFAILLAVAFCL